MSFGGDRDDAISKTTDKISANYRMRFAEHDCTARWRLLIISVRSFFSLLGSILDSLKSSRPGSGNGKQANNSPRKLHSVLHFPRDRSPDRQVRNSALASSLASKLVVCSNHVLLGKHKLMRLRE